MVSYATFNNGSVISWRSVLLMEETGVPGDNQQPVVSHWQTLSHDVVSSTPRHEWAIVVICTNCTGNCKSECDWKCKRTFCFRYVECPGTLLPYSVFLPCTSVFIPSEEIFYPSQRRIQGGGGVIVTFHTKYTKNVRTSLRSARFFYKWASPPNLKSWIRPC